MALAVGEAVFEYPNGEKYNIAMIIKVRDDLVAEETTYFAAPFDAPEWRRPYVDG